jgi:hypothetical protein
VHDLDNSLLHTPEIRQRWSTEAAKAQLAVNIEFIEAHIRMGGTMYELEDIPIQELETPEPVRNTDGSYTITFRPSVRVRETP